VIVVDAGAFLELLFATPGGGHVRDQMAVQECSAPELLDAEVLHRLLRARQQGTLTDEQVSHRLRVLVRAPLQRLSHRPLLARAQRLGAALSGYDALYAAAAEWLGATLLTTDGRLARTCNEQLAIPVTLVPTSGRAGR
jgi:predicted nucleic acid-binding protein